MSSETKNEREKGGRGHGKPKPKQVHVKVSFPLAGKRPYTDKVDAEASVETVRLAAMRHFGVADDQDATFYLTLHGQRIDGSAEIGFLAGDKHELKFTLAKELFQG